MTKEDAMGYEPTGMIDANIDTTRAGRFAMPYGYQWKMSRRELSALFAAVYWNPFVNCYEVGGYSDLFEPTPQAEHAPMYVMAWDGSKWTAERK